MEEVIRNLVQIRGLNFTISNDSLPPSEFILIGQVDSLQNFEVFHNNSLFIWYIREGITELNIFEVERWSVDAPPGSHLIISQRTLNSKLCNYTDDKNEIFFWGPYELSLWLGRAVLDGELDISVPTSQINDENFNSIIMANQSTYSPILTLKPNKDISTILSNNSYSQSHNTPVLIHCKLWKIDGELVSPEGLVEKQYWEIIEDPWESNFILLSENDLLNNTPSLQIISPRVNSWKEEPEVINSITPIINEKRQGKPKTSGLLTQSMIVQNWIFNPKNSHFSSTKIFIPGWLVNNKDRHLIHGITGNMHTMND
tara:strand:+ start:9749 stop:10690 length:942 start_codon:yes stop_codon:yes gene_type:complete